mmetsp:Transcript_93044/g.262309  ORF Transcript_93044/g.262309 Transcript_93044/m.262309 type:complete len:88 (-) Transcript_93044:68-331(-)
MSPVSLGLRMDQQLGVRGHQWSCQQLGRGLYIIVLAKVTLLIVRLESNTNKCDAQRFQVGPRLPEVAAFSKLKLAAMRRHCVLGRRE